MPVPPNNSHFWALAKCIVAAIFVLLFCKYNYKNGLAIQDLGIVGGFVGIIFGGNGIQNWWERRAAQRPVRRPKKP